MSATPPSDLVAGARAATTDGRLALSDLADDWPGLARLLDSLPGAEPPVLTSPRVSSVAVGDDPDHGIRVSGPTSLLGLDGLLFEALSPQSASDQCDVTLAVPDDVTLTLPGVDFVSISGLRVTLRAVRDEPVEGALTCTVQIGDRTLPFRLRLPPPDRVWRLGGELERLRLPNLEAVRPLLGGGQVLDLVPEPLRAIEDLELSALRLGVDADTGRLDHIEVGLAIGRWNLIDGGLALEAVDLDLIVHDPGGDRRLGGSVRGTLELGDRRIRLGGILDRGLRLQGIYPRLSIRELAERVIGPLSPAVPDVELRYATIVASTRADLEISGGAALDLAGLVERLGIELPAVLADTTLDRLTLEAHPADRTWRFECTSAAARELVSSEAGALRLSQVSLGARQDVDGTVASSVSLVVDGSATVADQAVVHVVGLGLSWDSAGAVWSATGVATLELLDHTERLETEVTGEGGDLVVRFWRTEPVDLSDLSGAGRVTVRELALTMTLAAEDTTFGLAGDLTLQLDGLFETTGRLGLSVGPDGPELELTTDPPGLPALRIPTGLTPTPEVELDVGPLQLRTGPRRRHPSGTELTDDEGGWSIEAPATLRLTGVPDLLDGYLPTGALDGYFRANARRVVVGCELDPPLTPEFPALSFGPPGERADLGAPGVTVEEVVVVLAAAPSIEERIRVDVPEALRGWLSALGLDILHERFRVRLALGASLGLTLLDSPVRDLVFYEDEERRRWTDWTFGEAGTVSFVVPELSFAAGRWRGRAGFRRRTDITLSLGGLKRVLRSSGWGPEILDALPDRLPLRDVDLTDDTLADELLGRAGPGASAVGDVVDEFLRTIHGALHALPERLRDYLVLRVPDSGIVDIEVDTRGGTRLAFQVADDDEPLRLLLPWFVPPVPALVGLTVRSFGLGQRLQGGAILLDIDGHLDMADLPSLVVGLPLDRAGDLTTRLVAERASVVLPAGLPLAIPLFFDRLELEYRDLGGLELTSRWRYPAPQLGPWDWVHLFISLIRFLFERDVLLHQGALPEALRLALTIGEQRLRLPSYLGGASLDLPELPPLDVDDSVARLLDAMKTARPAYLVEALPLRHPPDDGQWIRVGAVDIGFGPFRAAAQWCITTRTELDEVVRPAVAAGRVLTTDALDGIASTFPDLPVDLHADDEVVVLLFASTELAAPIDGASVPLLSLRQQFGLTLTRRGLATGLRWVGQLAGRLRLEISGLVENGQVATGETDGDGIGVVGHLGLWWQETSLIAFDGRLVVSTAGVEVDVTLALGRLSLRGHLLVGPDVPFALAGEVTWPWGPGGETLTVGAEVRVGREGLSLEVPWQLAGQDAALQIAVPGTDAPFAATVEVRPSAQLQERFRQGLAAHVQSVAGTAVDQIVSDLRATLTRAGRLELSLNGLREWLPPLCDGIRDTIIGAIEEGTTGARRPARGSATANAEPSLARLRRLAETVNIADDARFRVAVKRAIQDVIDHRALTVKVGSFSVGSGLARLRFDGFTVYETDDVLGARNVDQLRTAIGWVDSLAVESQRAVDTRQALSRFPTRDQLLARIGQDVEAGVEGAVPVIQSLRVATTLDVLDPTAAAAVIHLFYKGRQRRQTLVADLTDPEALARALAEVVGT